MSLSKYESDIQHLQIPADMAMEQLNDLRNLEFIKQQAESHADAIPEINGIPSEKIEEIKGYLKDLSFCQDSIDIQTTAGNFSLHVVERQPSCVKFEAQGSPMPICMWIQIVPEGGDASKMKVTLGAEVNMFMKAFVAKPLSKAAETLGFVIARTIQVSAQKGTQQA